MDGQFSGPLIDEALGAVAGTLTTMSFVPQVVKTLRSKSTRDISLSMWLLFTTGVAVWIVYGVAIGSVAVTVTNVITLILAGTVLTIKFRNLRTDASAQPGSGDLAQPD